jgi:hypothetical protein
VNIYDFTPWMGVTATRSTTSEGGVAGEVVVSYARSPLSKPVTVRLGFAGTATLNGDYQAQGVASGTVVIPANANSVTVPIVPISDALIEGEEVAVISVLEPAAGTDATYRVDPSRASASVTIGDAGVNKPQPTPIAFPGAGGGGGGGGCGVGSGLGLLGLLAALCAALRWRLPPARR